MKQRLSGTGKASDPIESLKSAIAFSARDWAASDGDAWIYGIVIGWGSALSEVASAHHWSQEDTERLRKLHLSFDKLSTPESD